MKKKWLNRMLISYVPVLFIVITILVVLFLLTVTELSKREAIKTNELLLENIMNTLDTKLQAVDQLIIQEILFEDTLDKLFRTGNLPQNRFLTEYEFSKKLKDIANKISHIDYLYVYRASDQAVFSNTAKFPLEQFGDRRFINEYLQASGPYLWIEKRSFEEFTGSFNTTSAVSLVRKVPLHSGDSGFVVVNVNVDSLQKTIQEMSESSSYYVQLLDRNGKLIVEKTDPSEDSQDDRHTNHYKSKYTGWELRSGISNGPLFVLASAISYLWVFAALFMVIAAGAWIAYISRINYRPIESIIAKIRDYANPRELGSRGAVRDEFQYIETALTDLIEDIAYQKKQQEENLVYRKRHLFQEAITGTRQISNREWNALLKELELGDEAPKVVFAIIEIDKYVQFSLMYNQRDQSLYKYWIEKGLHEISYDPFIKMWSEWMAGNQLGVMFILQDQAAAHARIHDICDSFRMWVNKHTRFTVTVGIGSCFEEISSLPSSYEEASSALNYKSVLGDNRIIEYFQIHPGSKDELVTYLQNIRVMSQLFKSGNPVWENHFEQVFNGLKVALLAQKDIINVLNYMMLYINREINSLPLSFREIWADSMMPQCLDILDRYETLADIQHNLKTKLDEMYSQFKGLRRVRSNYSLIEDVKYYLEQRYSDASLSLVSVSENFSINSSFLSRIFKEETGENFVDFLARIRIRHAELKLSETKMSVQEIARQVGYNNSLSFIRVFKKIVGHTPGDYRKTFK